MQELIDTLKSKHGFSDDVAKNVLRTFRDFLKIKYPMAAGALEGLFSTNENNQPFNTTDPIPSSAASYFPEGALQSDQQLSKDKQSGFYEGNKRDY